MTDGALEDQQRVTSVLGELDVETAAAGPRTRAEHLAAAVEARIRARGMAAGSPVGTIEEIRTGSGFARATVNEAVRLLADRGVLVIRPGRNGGLFVADQGPVVRMRRTLLGVREDPSTVADAVELRNHLEELIDLGAARRCGEADARALRAHLAAMAEAPDWGGFVRANWALHEQLAGLCPNAMARAVYIGTLGHLSAASPQLADAPSTSGDRADHTPATDDAAAYRAARMQVHVDLVEAVVAGDEAAVRAAVVRHNATG